jgi:hypothetical protein
MLKYATSFFLLLSVIFCGSGYAIQNNEKHQPAFHTIQDVPTATWRKLEHQRIYFGHHSVGQNILEGVKDVIAEFPQIKLNVVNIKKEDSHLSTPIFAHSKIGKNQHPISKTQRFDALMDEGLGSTSDISFFKFCFIDFNSTTDIDAVFNDYSKTMARLKKKYPKTIFIHFTIPLICFPAGIDGMVMRTKNFVKKTLGMDNQWDFSSSKFFNEKIREKYYGVEPLFDLAKIESTDPTTGERNSFTSGGVTYFQLLPKFTDDGGHLNKEGRHVVAEKLLLYLATLLEKNDKK